MVICCNCHCDPCLVSLHQDALTGQLSILAHTMSSSHKRNVLYHCFVQTEYGVLGKCNQVCIPLCIVQFICSICPSDDGRYTGHQAAGGGGVMLTKMTQKRMMLSTHLMRRLRRKHLLRLFILRRAKPFVCPCFSRLASSVLSMSIRLFLNLPSKDGKFLTNRNYSLQPPSFAKMKTPIRHCACFVLEKLMIALSSRVL